MLRLQDHIQEITRSNAVRQLKMNRTFTLFALMLLTGLPLISAATGVGISPTESRLQIEAGQEQTLNIVVFNSGDSLLKVSLHPEGDVAPFVKVEGTEVSIEPEPQPHALPIKNGKTYALRVKVPAGTKPGIYNGEIAVVGSVAGSSQFGGSVGVASRLVVTVVPATSLFAKIPRMYYVIIAIIIAIIALWFALKKAGIQITVQKSAPSK